MNVESYSGVPTSADRVILYTSNPLVYRTLFKMESDKFIDYYSHLLMTSDANLKSSYNKNKYSDIDFLGHNVNLDSILFFELSEVLDTECYQVIKLNSNETFLTLNLDRDVVKVEFMDGLNLLMRLEFDDDSINGGFNSELTPRYLRFKVNNDTLSNNDFKMSSIINKDNIDKLLINSLNDEELSLYNYNSKFGFNKLMRVNSLILEEEVLRSQEYGLLISSIKTAITTINEFKVSKFTLGRYYSVGDIVIYGGELYKCISATNLSPVGDPTKWQYDPGL